MSSGFADDVYLPQPDPDAQDPLEQLDGSDTLISGPDDLDTGYSPPERPLALRDPETLDERLAEEVPDTEDLPEDWDGLGDYAGGDGELIGDQVGGRRVRPPAGPRRGRALRRQRRPGGAGRRHRRRRGLRGGGGDARRRRRGTGRGIRRRGRVTLADPGGSRRFSPVLGVSSSPGPCGSTRGASRPKDREYPQMYELPAGPPPPPAHHTGHAPSRRRDPAASRGLHPAVVRQGDGERADADLVDARRRAAHPGVGAEGRGRGGRRGARRRHAVRGPGGEGRAGHGRHRPGRDPAAHAVRSARRSRRPAS